jgi:hypothetical protein
MLNKIGEYVHNELSATVVGDVREIQSIFG